MTRAYIQIAGLVIVGVAASFFGVQELAVMTYSATMIILNQHQM